MQPDKVKATRRKPGREGFEAAFSSKQLGRKPQRRQFQPQMESSGPASTAAHGEDSSFDSPSSPPRHDRAG